MSSKKAVLDVPSLIARHHSKMLGTGGGQQVPYTEPELIALLLEARKVFADEHTLVKVKAPIVVVGDIHGQYTDLHRVLKIRGVPPATNYIFLGDYVDRGRQSLECIVLLLAFKIQYPKNFFLLRGNHECANINRVYGFYDECNRRFGPRLWRGFQSVFDVIPLAGLIGGRILCMHGGISPELNELSQIRSFSRPLNYLNFAKDGLLCDLLWADPDYSINGWARSIRGISHNFGADIVKEFCQKLHLDLIVRAHQVVQDGFQFFADKKLVTVFSAPNYCNEFNNMGAVMVVQKNMECKFRTLAAISANPNAKPTPTGTAASNP